MRTLSCPRIIAVAALSLLGLVQSALADPIDDYVACLIGKSAVELNKQEEGKRDAEAAQETAYKQCRQPADLSTEEGDLGDFVNLMVEAMAARLGGN